MGNPPQWSSHRKQADWGKNLKYGESPQWSSHRKQVNWGKNLKYEKSPNRAVTGSKWVGVKQQKSGKYSKLEELHEA